jgi:NADPH:quinone reductase-like Zn-dependent oxidoreductase
VLSYYAPIPPSLDFPGAAALPAAIEMATRALDALGAGAGSTLLVNGASGSVGSAAVQLAVVRGSRVIGTASPANHDYLRSLGAEPVACGEGLAGRVRALAPHGADAALDVAGSGVLPELIELAGGLEHVVTIADFGGAQQHGVRFSSGDTGRAVHALAEIGELIEPGRFSLPVAQTIPLAEIAGAPGQRGRLRAREACAGGRLSFVRVQVMHADSTTAARQVMASLSYRVARALHCLASHGHAQWSCLESLDLREPPFGAPV